MKAYDGCKKGDILVLDLTGIRSRWLKDNVYPIVYFFVEMNFIAPCGVSTVMLWNVPISAVDVIEQAYAEVRRSKGQLGDWRRLPLLICDDRSVHVFTDSADARLVVEMLSREGTLAVDDLVSNVTAMSRRDFETLVAENPHLFEHNASTDTVRLRTWWRSVRDAARDANTGWLEKLIDTPVEDKGALWKKRDVLYQLPSTGFLVDRFYGFSRMLSSHEATFRLAWLFADRIIDFVELRGRIDYLISVTRVTERLTERISDIVTHVLGTRLTVIAETTILALQARCRTIAEEGTAIFVTDVVSSGRLSFQVTKVAGPIKIVLAMCLLDTRSPGESSGPALSGFGLGASEYVADGIGPSNHGVRETGHREEIPGRYRQKDGSPN